MIEIKKKTFFQDLIFLFQDQKQRKFCSQKRTSICRSWHSWRLQSGRCSASRTAESPDAGTPEKMELRCSVYLLFPVEIFNFKISVDPNYAATLVQRLLESKVSFSNDFAIVLWDSEWERETGWTGSSRRIANGGRPVFVWKRYRWNHHSHWGRTHFCCW